MDSMEITTLHNNNEQHSNDIRLKIAIEKLRQKDIEIEKLKHSLRMTQMKLENAEYITNPGHFIWRVHGFNDQLILERTGVQQFITSPQFYTASGSGYNCKLTSYLNGLHSGKNYMSLYMDVCPGINDGNLEWPVNMKITLRLLDLSDMKQHVSKGISTHKCKPHGNMQWGFDKFLCHNDVKRFVVDGCLNIECVIDVE